MSKPPLPSESPHTDQPAQPGTDIESNLGLVHHIVGRYYNRSSADYDDAIQEGSLALLRASQTFDSTKGKWSTYAGRCIRNAVIDLLRSTTNQSGEVSLDDLDPSIPNADHDEAQDDPEWRMQRQVLRHLMQQLPEIERKVIRLRYGFDGEEPISQRETAKRLDLPRTTAINAENRALRRLRARFVVP